MLASAYETQSESNQHIETDIQNTGQTRNEPDSSESCLEQTVIENIDQELDLSDSRLEQIIMYESQITASSIQLEAEIADNSLQTQVELLEAEINKHRKINGSQKSEIKRLQTENDKLRKELSRFTGIRKFCVNNDTQRESNQSNECNDRANRKYNNLRNHMSDIAHSIINVLDNDEVDAEFQEVVSQRRSLRMRPRTLLNLQRSLQRHPQPLWRRHPSPAPAPAPVPNLGAPNLALGAPNLHQN